MAVRLRDVAEHAGVSVKTVSNVVHGHPAVSRPMRAKVQASIEALGYVPNISARSLRTGRSGLIGLAVPRITDPYFCDVAAAVIDAATARGLSVLVEQTGGEYLRENDVLLGRRPTIVDGLIFSPISVTQTALDEASPAVPLVLLGEHLLASQRSRVAVDNVAASAEAVGHLLGQGRRRVAAVGAKRGSTAATAELRLAGYHRALAEAGVDPDDALEVPTDALHPGGRQSGRSRTSSPRARCSTPCSASTTCWPSAPWRPCTATAVRCRGTSRSSGSTTSTRGGTRVPR